MVDVIDVRRDAVTAALADLGRPQPLRDDDRVRAMAVLAEFRRAQRRRTHVRTVTAGVLAMAAGVALVWFVGPELRARVLGSTGLEQAGAMSEQSTGGRATERIDERDAAPRSVRKEPASQPVPAAEEPVVVIPEPELAEPAVTPEPERPRAVKPTPRVTESAGEILAAARELAGAGKLAAAASAYQRLLDTYPDSSEGKAALVSLGRVQASRGRHTAALAAFTRYLDKGGGPLAEEAYFGRIGALHATGRANERDAAIDALAKAHPRSVYLNKARALAK